MDSLAPKRCELFYLPIFAFISFFYLFSVPLISVEKTLSDTLFYSWISSLFLLKYFYFYATGHETTFTHIRWDSAFHGIYGDSNNQLIRGLMALLILTNTFSSIIITPVSVLFYFSAFDDSKRENKYFIFTKQKLYGSLKVWI